MRTSFGVDDMTIHRIVEQENGFTPVLEFLPGLSRELLEENRSWMEPAALDPETDKLVLCFQSYVVKTPHHTVLVDSCIGNDKIRPARDAWNRKTDDHYMRALAAAGVSVDDIDFVMCTTCMPIMSGGTPGCRTADGSRPSRMRAICFPAKSTTTGPASTPRAGSNHSPIACCRSSRQKEPIWSAASMHSTIMSD